MNTKLLLPVLVGLLVPFHVGNSGPEKRVGAVVRVLQPVRLSAAVHPSGGLVLLEGRK